MDDLEIRRRYWEQVPSAKRLEKILNVVLGFEKNERVASLKPQHDLPNSFLRDHIFASARICRDDLTRHRPGPGQRSRAAISYQYLAGCIG